MGPTTIALVTLFKADQALREAQGRLDSASSSVRIQARRIADLNEKFTLAQSQLRQQQAKASDLDLEIKAREGKIERLRQQQQTSRNHKEYQAFLTEINTEKIDKGKLEDEMLKSMETVEQSQQLVNELTAQLAADQKKLDEIKAKLSGRLAELQAEVDALRPARDEAAKTVPPKALAMFDRLAEHHEGEAMAPIGKPNRRTEEYVCTACHLSLVADIYNRLHSRDEPVVCPSCRRLLFIPDDLPPELALNTRSTRKVAAAAEQEE